MGRQYEGASVDKKKVRNKRTGKMEKSKNYYLRYQDPISGKPVYESTGFGNIEGAEAYREERLNELRAGVMGSPLSANHISIAQVLTDYARHIAGEPALERLGYSMRPILEFWKEQPVSAINVETFKQYVETRSKLKKSAWTIRRELTDLRASVNHAQTMTRLLPFQFPALPPKGKSRVRYLTRDEVSRLLRSARQEFKAKFALTLFIVIAYHTGARKGAIMDLKWNQIDFDWNRIDFGEGNGNKKRAKIPIPPIVGSLLRIRFRRFSNKSAYVFHHKHDPQRRLKSINKSFRAATLRADLNDVTPHTLRHTRVSELVQEGYSITAISKYMAMSAQTILDVYAHAADEEVEEIAQNIGRSQKVRTINEKARKKTEKQGKTGKVQK